MPMRETSAHQPRCGENRYPDDFMLLSCPCDTENHRLRFAENQLPAEAYSAIGERKAALAEDAENCGFRVLGYPPDGLYHRGGYDPMHMIEYDRKILCTHFAALQEGEERLFPKGSVLLEQKEKGSRAVAEYWRRSGI